ncbi:site-2 protease family protein [Olsenella sp. An270]|uniref:site-2 protease family protein n=1 Tax=Olsenella sp. An270 TaxID=1965615 RepID=UPI000B55244C|nr:site-2 protease family protein [Olsenella sp. An270]OUO61013.1 site-2 protease family protein [Olsenella sp. An270]
MGYSIDTIVSVVITVLLVMASAIVHEVAHGWAALLCGDTTARDAGRLTLDPRAHLDGFGSLLLPLVMALLGGPVFAFAKPVPYNPYKLRHPRRDELLVALAGPASNLAQALLGAVVLNLSWSAIVEGVLTGALSTDVASLLLQVLSTYVMVNLVLCFFNLIPLPPLDGSKVVLFFLSGEARARYYRLEQYAMPILIIALYVLPSLLRLDPVGIYLDWTAGGLYDLLLTGL